MELHIRDKKVLTLANKVRTKEFVSYAEYKLGFEQNQIRDSLDYLLKSGLLSIMTVPTSTGDVNMFFHTREVTPQMLVQDKYITEAMNKFGKKKEF
ncbi:MAG: hypothetical protein WCK90_05975 [archaeon]